MLPKIILHLDMNSYFASVEQQANPYLRGKPVGVCATMSPNGCIIASSVEAKAKGIKTGVRVKEARAIDPNIILIPNDSDKYRSVTEGFLKIVRRYTEDVEVYSIDEVFLNLTGFIHGFSQAQTIAGQIRDAIQTEVGDWLRCSIGIAPTRWLAKFAGDTAAKGEIKIVHRGNLHETLDPRPLTDAWGIASALERRLQNLSIWKLGDLRRAAPINLMQALGIMGYQLWANVNGLEMAGVQVNQLPKSIGHQHVFARRATSLDYPKAVLAKLCERAGRRLRGHGFEAYGVWCSYGLSDQDFSRFGRHGGGGGRKLSVPLYDTQSIFHECWNILTSDLPPGTLPRSLFMGLFRLQPKSNQLRLWPLAKQQDSPALAQALDEVNDKYGDFTVTRGSLWGLEERDAPDRIGFRKSVVFDESRQQYRW